MHKHECMVKLMHILLAAGMTLTGCGHAPEPTAAASGPSLQPVTEVPEEPEVHTLSLFMAGDCLIHGAIDADAMQADGTYDFHPMFADLKDELNGFDLKYYNQETILGGTELGISSYPMFNSPQEVGSAAIDTGFNLVSLANNHSLDRSDAGIEASMQFWNAHPEIITAGTSLSQEQQKEIPVHEMNDITFAFLSWTYGTNGLVPPEGKEYLVNVYAGHEAEMLEQVREAKQLADVVIVAMHWGVEYQMEPNEEQKRLAQALSDAGADIIIGCHPHVIEPISWINGRTICFYSLGNMISAQYDEADLIGMEAGLTIVKTIDDHGASVALQDVRADLLYTYYTPGMSGFRTIPFSKLSTELVPDRDRLYEQYAPYITMYEPDIQVGMEQHD